MLCSPEDLELNVWIVRAALSLDGVRWQVFHDGKSVAPAGADLQFDGRRVAEEGSTHHPSAAIGDGVERRFWYTENAGQGKGYRIAAGMLMFEQAAEDRRTAPRP